MASVKFKKGLVANLPSTYSEGTFYVTTDERAMYLDISESSRIRLGDFQEFDNLQALQNNTNPSTSALYYIKDINCLAKFNGTGYVQINLDTGATDVEVVGDGNAITAVSYDENTRKITFTKGASYLPSSKVGDVGDGTIKDYVDGKASAASNIIESIEIAGQSAAIDENKKASIPAENLKTGLGLGSAAYTDTGAYATAEQGGKADSAYQKPETGIPVGDLAEGVKTSLGKADTAYQKPDGGIVLADLAQSIKDSLAKADSAVQSVTDYTVTVTESTPEGYAKAYIIAQSATGLNATINIPKDMVVSSGSVVTKDAAGEWGEAGTYLMLTLANASSDKLYINVGNLIEYVTSGSVEGDAIQIAIDNDHKVTASIKDGSIGIGKLDSETSGKINQAHEHSNGSVLDGISAEDVASWDGKTTMEAVEGKGYQTAAQVKGIKVDNASNADKVGNALTIGSKTFDGSAAVSITYSDVGADASGAADTAESNAKSYADGLVTWGSF